MGAKEVDKALRESFKKGLAVRKSIADLKESKKLEKGEKAKKTRGTLSVASSSSSGVPDNPPVPLDERLNGPTSLTLGELMTSERLNYEDALRVFLNVRQEFEEQAKNEAKANSKTSRKRKAEETPNEEEDDEPDSPDPTKPPKASPKTRGKPKAKGKAKPLPKEPEEEEEESDNQDPGKLLKATPKTRATPKTKSKASHTAKEPQEEEEEKEDSPEAAKPPTRATPKSKADQEDKEHDLAILPKASPKTRVSPKGKAKGKPKPLPKEPEEEENDYSPKSGKLSKANPKGRATPKAKDEEHDSPDPAKPPKASPKTRGKPKAKGNAKPLPKEPEEEEEEFDESQDSANLPKATPKSRATPKAKSKATCTAEEPQEDEEEENQEEEEDIAAEPKKKATPKSKAATIRRTKKRALKRKNAKESLEEDAAKSTKSRAITARTPPKVRLHGKTKPARKNQKVPPAPHPDEADTQLENLGNQSGDDSDGLAPQHEEEEHSEHHDDTEHTEQDDDEEQEDGEKRPEQNDEEQQEDDGEEHPEQHDEEEQPEEDKDDDQDSPESCLTFKAGQHSLNYAGEAALRGTLARGDSLSDLSDLLKTSLVLNPMPETLNYLCSHTPPCYQLKPNHDPRLGPSASQLGYAEELSGLLRRVDGLVQSKEAESSAKAAAAKPEPGSKPASPPKRKKTASKPASPSKQTAESPEKPSAAKPPAPAARKPALLALPATAGQVEGQEREGVDRFYKAGKFDGCPNVKMLMEGSLEDRNKALREWVTFGGNAAQMEAKLSFERTSSVLGQRVWEQVAVKDMRHPPYSFSKLPGVDLTQCMCYVLAAMIALQLLLEDPDAPGCLEETRFWCVVKRIKTESESQVMRASMNANMQGSVGMLDGLIANGNQNMPGILRRAKSSNAVNKPLSGDVLRAFDDYNKDLAELLRRLVAADVEQKSLIEESFRTDEEKHSKFSQAVKKEIGAMSTLLLDLQQCNCPDLLKSLKDHDAKIKKLALKLGMLKSGPEFGDLCQEAFDEIEKLKLVKGQASGLLKELRKRPLEVAAKPRLVKATTDGDASLKLTCDLGDTYDSSLLHGYESRPLREDEYMSRVRKAGYALPTEVTYVAAPVIRGEEEATALIEELFVDSMYPSSSDLEAYWAQLLPDFNGHWLTQQPDIWHCTIPIVLWGDEGTADLSIFREHSKASRYMIYSLLASKYWIQGKTNETLQQLNAAVANDINGVMQKGIETTSGETYYFVVVAFRGDLKYLTQCFNFVRNSSTDKARSTAPTILADVSGLVVWVTMRSDPAMIYTDINADAGWTATEFSDVEPPWVDPPAFAAIDGFDLRMVQVDWMHTWSLGVAQDVLGSAIKLMCKGKMFYTGSNIQKRLSQLYRDLKIYAAANGKALSCKRLRKRTLRWENGCPELHVKAADIAVFLPFVLAKLQEVPMEGPYTGLLAMVWAADEFSRSVMASRTFLTVDQQQHTRTVGDLFLSTFCLLAQQARDRGEYYFKMRPKFHHLIHMVRDSRPSRRSPGWDNCYMDEDHVRHCIRVLRKVSHRTAEKTLLLRNAVQVKQTMLQCLRIGPSATASAPADGPAAASATAHRSPPTVPDRPDQEQFRGEAVDPLIRRAMRRYARALKAIFAVDRLVALVARVDPPGSDAWSPWVTAHAVDALILAVWFMLREIEFSAAQTQDIDVADGTVALRLPLHKTATGGEVEMTQRQLRCACGATVAPLCPHHAALRHVARLRRAGRWVRGAPLFPDGTGDTWEKSGGVLFFRRVLLAAGIQLTTTHHNGATVQLFNGHLARVAGAAWLASKAVNTPIIQLLGRWSSAAVERYVQAAPLAVAPDVPRRILGDEVEIVSVRPAYAEATAPPALGSRRPLALQNGEPVKQETPPQEDHSATVAFEPGPVRPDAVQQVAVAPPEHLIYNERQKRAHAPDPTEASSDRFLWKARGCSWPYGVRSFYRITELRPAGAAKCLRCFPKAPSADGEGTPTEEAASPVASSSDSDESSPSLRIGILMCNRSPAFDRTALHSRRPSRRDHGYGSAARRRRPDRLPDDLATSAGAGPDLVEYLKARSLNRTATLSPSVFQPFRDGDEIAGKIYKAAPAEQPVVRHMCREWTDLVARYNAVQLGGEPRSFPVERLVGSEEVLARIHWEHTRSKLYTPLGLGEILATRTWSSLGVVNPLAGRRSTGGAQSIKFKFVDGGLAVEENQPFVPRGIWAVVDGLDAIRWAWVLTGVGTEAGVIRHIDWWTTKARLHSSRLEAVLAYWDATAHQLAMSMRLAWTFEEVTSAIMADQAAFNEEQDWDEDGASKDWVVISTRTGKGSGQLTVGCMLLPDPSMSAFFVMSAVVCS
ncbi:unnamed protein product [Symbiodinium sp. CCMP2592]|nr:unnamed protein product [Symbiodinium sp. CCMP2592]